MLDTILIDKVSDAILGGKMTYLDIAGMDVVEVSNKVRENRWEHPEIDQLPASDEEIAQAILEHALSKAPDSRVLIIRLLAEQKRQTQLLQTVAWAAGLWLALVLFQWIAEALHLF